jgi:hypothetical protein
MRRYLVVANLTLGGEHLAERVRACLAEGPCSFHILVPASPPHGSWTSEEGDEVALARERLDAALGRFGGQRRPAQRLLARQLLPGQPPQQARNDRDPEQHDRDGPPARPGIAGRVLPGDPRPVNLA